ncbi:MAG: hypothetical protein Q7T55_08945 [Solirubrobacteraceae bacterium]|nr:hypothetical protein [Solirubrobacteraceae bacterium]
MIKELSEKIIKLSEKDLYIIEGCFLLMGILCLLLFYIFGCIIGEYTTQIEITDKLISLSDSDNNFFKINNQIYEVRKVNNSYITDLSVDITHNYSNR